jgi:hypothetical protein
MDTHFLALTCPLFGSGVHRRKGPCGPLLLDEARAVDGVRSGWHRPNIHDWWVGLNDEGTFDKVSCSDGEPSRVEPFGTDCGFPCEAPCP